ncbi:probable inactive receptor kinase At2g26730 [Impatiens glandulifera]|uniref:probable inactive receptor kinase At2g26730 n=1 Tax=Impatiens glandulifera TaxID=253017 RepID=UPI001FB0FA1A|nr:probable inactive receptor kinase At2g26730 [Impatiens glandulifera]
MAAKKRGVVVAVCYYLLMITWMSLLVLQNHHHFVDSTAAATLQEQEEEKIALFSLLDSTKQKPQVKWTTVTPNACKWPGVTCDENDRVKCLNLPGKSFIGRIPENTIGKLTKLRVLSIPHNGFTGTLPSDLSNLTLLRTLNLRNNKFDGKFPTLITHLRALKFVDLAVNKFSGEIPCEIQNMPILVELRLENNSFTGNLPGLHFLRSVNFSVANNNINGVVPTTLSNLPFKAFTGNPLMCGEPLFSRCIYNTNQSHFFFRKYCPALTPQPNPAIATFAMSGGAALFLLLFLVILLFPVRRKQRPTTNSDKIQTKSQSKSSFHQRRKLIIFPENNQNSTNTDSSSWANGIDATDIMSGGSVLMKPPPLAKGVIGTSYKVELMSVTDKVLVVKHLMDPEAVVSDELDFANKMEFLGKIRHGNVMPLRGYCIYEEEYLMIYDFIPGGSLYDCLHVNGFHLDWESRKRIALGVARGLAHLHTKKKLVHGNIKSSNILLHGEYPAALDAYVADFGLTATPPTSYYGPETSTTTTVDTNIKDDVYAFGVLLLELLSGKSPEMQSSAAAAASEGGTSSDNDEKKKMGMVCLRQIAKQCTHEAANERPEMEKVARMIENIDDVKNMSREDDQKLTHEISEEDSLLYPGTPPPPPAFTP